MNKFLMTLSFLLGLSACSHFENFKNEREDQGKKQHTLLWNRNFDPLYDSGNLPISANTPTIYDHFLFMGDQKGKMLAMDLSTGRVLWHSDDDKIFNGQAAVHKDQLIYSTEEGRLYSRNLHTGLLSYMMDLGYPVETAATFYEGRACVQLRNHSTTCFDAETGKVLWTYKRTVGAFTTIQRMSRPLIYKNKVFVGHADGVITALNLEDGSVLWEQKLSTAMKFNDVDNPPVLFKDFLYVAALGGNLTKLDPSTGQILRVYDAANASRPPNFLPGGETFSVGTTDGKVKIIDLHGNVVKERDFNSLAPVVGPILWKNELVVAVGKTLYFLNKEDLTTMSTYSLGHNYSFVLGDFEFSEEYLSVYSSRNRLYLFH